MSDEKESYYDNLGCAAVILALCLGLSTCHIAGAIVDSISTKQPKASEHTQPQDGGRE